MTASLATQRSKYSKDWGHFMPLGSGGQYARSAYQTVSRSGSVNIRVDADPFAGLSLLDQLWELLAALSVTKSQLTGILRVPRPTLNEWFQGRAPSPTGADRIDALFNILRRARISSERPLNARFVRRPVADNQDSLVSLLSEEVLNDAQILAVIQQAQTFDQQAEEDTRKREAHLRSLGFEEVSPERRREQLALNIALSPWSQQ